MVKKHKEKRFVEQEVVDEIVCNRCGKPVHKSKNMCGNTMFVDYVHFGGTQVVNEGMDTFIGDFHLCEDCCKELNKQFKIPVRVFKV